LLEEAHLAQVIDPAGGSWYVESLTGELARAAWEWFRAIEATGGMTAALDSGVVADRLAATWTQRQDAIAHRKDPITGVSEYPDLQERILQRDPAPARASGGLPRHRYAEGFEALRDAADERLATTGSRPKVFLATLGSIAEHNARALFARNLFAAGGIATPDAGATESTQDVLDAFADADAAVVCLCSSDEVYADRAEETAAALRAAGAQHILLAGKPSDPPPAGIDGFVHTGCDALKVLQDIHRRWAQQ
jgi:methylmalonyl-CoA mutase